MSELLTMLGERRAALARLVPGWLKGRWGRRGGVVALIVAAAIMPLFFSDTSNFIDKEILALAYVVFALGLNIVVGFAGLLDLGYVAFFALGAYTLGWFGSDFFFKADAHVLVNTYSGSLPGIHLNFLLILVGAMLITSTAGILIGLPTLRLRGDYIAIVTLAFGEIIRVFAINGPSIHVAGMPLTAGVLGISGIDSPYFPGVGTFDQLHLRPWYWLVLALVLITLFVNVRIRDSRLGRAWIALREDEVAAVSMGIPLVRTKLLAYALGATFGGIAGAFLGAYTTLVTPDQFQFGFSVFVLAMVIVGGLGSIWGVVFGALLLANINYYLIPDVLDHLPSKVGLNFNLSDLQVSIFGFLLVLVMVLRPQGLIPERRRKLELTSEIAADDAQVVTAGAP